MFRSRHASGNPHPILFTTAEIESTHKMVNHSFNAHTSVFGCVTGTYFEKTVSQKMLN